MTLTTPYSATFIVGDGDTKVFPYLFEEVSENFITVIVYNSISGLSSTPTYIVDTDQKQIIFGDETPAPTADETVCIYRNTPNIQDVAFRTLQGYDAKTLENILSKIVAMIQEIKSNYFTTQVLQGDPWQLDLLSSEDDGATVNIDYTAKKLVKGLYFRITNGNLQVSGDGSNYITMPKSADVAEFRQVQQELPDHTIINRLEYRVGSTWYQADPSVPIKYGASLEMVMDASTFVISATLKDQDGNVLGTTQTIDLPLESVVVSGSYDNVTKSLILTLENGNTITIPVADLISGLQETLVSGVNIKTINNNSVLGAGDLTIDSLPSQTGQGGKFLTTDGTDASWANVDALPSQTGQNGKFLTTDGTDASWTNVDALPAQTGQGGKFLTTDGTDASWATVDALPSQTGNSGKFLTTDGSSASWSVVNADGVVNKNSAAGATNPIYDWVGTLAEYTAQDVATNHPDWVCFITDDNGNQLIDFQLPTSQNSYTWYMKFANGLVLQGGRATTNNSGTPKFINIPVEMESTNYYPLLQGQTDQSSYNGAQWQIMPTANSTYPASTTGFYALGSITGYSLYFTWFIAGRYA